MSTAARWREDLHPRDARGRFAGGITTTVLGDDGRHHTSAHVTGTDQSDWTIEAVRDGNRTPFPYREDFGDPRDETLMVQAAQQGFDGLPVRGDVDAAVAAGGVQIHRGLLDSTWNGKSAQDLADDFTGGPYEPGTGVHGNGYYFTTSPGVAAMYADRRVSHGGYDAPSTEGGVVVRAALHPQARIVDYDDLVAEAKATWQQWHDRFDHQVLTNDFTARDGMINPGIDIVLYDPGRFAAMRGYDAIRVPLSARQADRRNRKRIAKITGSDDLGDEYVVVNRTAVIVS